MVSRLESICEPEHVMVSSTTYDLTRDRIEYEHQGEVNVKGIHTPLNVYRVVGKKQALFIRDIFSSAC